MKLWHRLARRLGFRYDAPRTFALDDELLATVQALAKAERRSTDEVAAELISRGLAQLDWAQDIRRRWRSLSPREQQVVALVCQDYTNRQIAAKLYLSVDTVKVYVRNAQRKFDVHSKRELQLLLAEWNLDA